MEQESNQTPDANQIMDMVTPEDDHGMEEDDGSNSNFTYDDETMALEENLYDVQVQVSYALLNQQTGQVVIAIPVVNQQFVAIDPLSNSEKKLMEDNFQATIQQIDEFGDNGSI